MKFPTYEDKDGTNLAEVGTDCISRQAAIDALDEQIAQCNKAIKSFVLSMKDEYAAKVEKASLTAFRERLEYLPPAQPEQHIDEWCYSCKEYDKEKHSCPRWNKVIKNTVDELKSAQPEPCEDAVSRTEILRMINCINDHHAITPYKSVGAVTEHLTRIASSLPPVTPKRGKCKWCERLKERNLRIEYYWIDQEGCTASFSEPHIVATGIAKFCPNCGAKITEGDAE